MQKREGGSPNNKRLPMIVKGIWADKYLIGLHAETLVVQGKDQPQLSRQKITKKRAKQSGPKTMAAIPRPNPHSTKTSSASF